MGQKVHPIGFRIPVTKDWQSRWFARKAEFGPLLMEDLRIRDYVKAQLQQAAISKVTIERFANRVRVTVFSGRPGLVIGRKGQEIERLKGEIAKVANGKEVYLDIREIKTPELDAQLVAENVAQQLERRISFRRAMKRTIQTTREMGADGVRIRCAGRLGGAELARTEQYLDGKVPLQTLRANVDYGFAEARTMAGAIGVKVWICKPREMEGEQNATDAKTRKAPKGAKRRPRGQGNS
ncbi:MAG: 30S ribosomal protein S3 [Lentisphaerae bacterium RIFOXYB12_FULL_65_16]|nr:MAG: 30S ribosomal protein S3 [Lentisphaerae bacterium RIFOXYA12_64_32]OGV90158.1 MAG: 30S ribosomal protein S3 [Lentisphaerae bacterium RIFOXYB12_FULL_65_16]